MKNRLKTLLHETFRVGITLKGVDGALETIGGVLVWLVTPASARRIVRLLFHHEVSEGPRHFFANHLIVATQGLAARKRFASAFLLSHGLTKVVLVIALWFNRLWAYPLLILVLAAFIVYQVHRFIYTHSLVLAALTLFDLLIVWLTWREYREQRRIRQSQDSH